MKVLSDIISPLQLQKRSKQLTEHQQTMTEKSVACRVSQRSDWSSPHCCFFLLLLRKNTDHVKHTHYADNRQTCSLWTTTIKPQVYKENKRTKVCTAAAVWNKSLYFSLFYHTFLSLGTSCFCMSWSNASGSSENCSETEEIWTFISVLTSHSYKCDTHAVVKTSISTAAGCATKPQEQLKSHDRPESLLQLLANRKTLQLMVSSTRWCWNNFQVKTRTRVNMKTGTSRMVCKLYFVLSSTVEIHVYWSDSTHARHTAQETQRWTWVSR